MKEVDLALKQTISLEGQENEKERATDGQADKNEELVCT